MGIGFYPIQEKAERIYSILFYLVRELKSIGVMVKIFPLIALNIVVKNFFSLWSSGSLLPPNPTPKSF